MIFDLRKANSMMLAIPGHKIRRLSVFLATVAWMATAAGGFRALENYETTPGATGRPPLDWPVGTALSFVPGRPNVVMAVHPRCPCSQASLALLAEIARRSPAPASLRLLVFRPEGAGRGWAGDSFLPADMRMDGVSLVEDSGGHEAARFGLATSGAVAAFDAAGHLRYSGGLTAGRGRESASEGAEAVSAVLACREPGRVAAAVFGCGIIHPKSRPISGRVKP
jgi:hypothetical protein